MYINNLLKNILIQDIFSKTLRLNIFIEHKKYKSVIKNYYV